MWNRGSGEILHVVSQMYFFILKWLNKWTLFKANFYKACEIYNSVILDTFCPFCYFFEGGGTAVQNKYWYNFGALARP